MTFESILGAFYREVPYVTLSVLRQYAEPFIEGTERRVICTLNGVHQIHAGLMPDGKGDYFININKALRKKLGVDIGDTIKVHLAKDNSKYGMAMPEEFEELLHQDPEGADYFHQLTPGKQRSLIFLVAKPKTSNTRLKKAVVILDFLKANRGKLEDYKLLNQAFREA